MRVDAVGYLQKAQDAGPQAAAAEALGYDSWSAPETQADVFVSCTVAALQTNQIGIKTGIAVAFARSPMSLAYQANDLQLLSDGRFVLGLGSQVKAHITRRFSMEYSRPAARMRDLILALRAIWRAWETGDKLDFRGEFYAHTLMTPFFDPGPNPHGNPPVWLAAVGPLMTEVAGEVADGVVCHGFGTERYLREVTLPALQRGAAKAGRDLAGFEINAPGFVVAADTEEEMAAGIAEVRRQIGFYGSTPAYRALLELHGWGDLGDKLTELSKAGEWARMSTLIDEDVLNTFAVIGTPEEAAAELTRRYGDVATRVALPFAPGADAQRWQPVFEALRDTEPTFRVG
jgi:probable F420-dependent oxidoreductase